MTLPLFAEPTADDGYGPSRGACFDAIDAAARKKLNAPDTWRAWSWEVVTRGDPHSPLLVTGDIPVGVNKHGGPIWGKGEGQRTVITDADIEAAKIEYERTSGKCADCIEGQRFAGWHYQKGYKYKPCERCGAIGRRTVGEREAKDG